MNRPDPTAEAQAIRPRSGWGAPIALALLTIAFSVAGQAGLLLFVPLALLLLAIPPRRPGLIGLGAILLLVAYLGRAPGDPLWWFSRGWALMLGAWFVVLTTLRPSAKFLDRGLGAVFGTAASAALMFVVTRSGWETLDTTVSARLHDSASAAAAQFGPSLAARDWGAEAVQAMTRAADLQAVIFPALLALASLTALGVAWWLWRRLTVREPQPLAALREFRFRDELVWLAVIAVVLIVLPLGQEPTRAGTNLATFMGALYALRGLAVALAMFGPPGPFGVLLGVFAGVVLFPFVVATTVMLGLTDTWLDLRSRIRPAVPPTGS
ncbi:MAG TPA: DUF2232 domain-containing protein [Longimicrobiales bacterium]|nr:DUF2232 domain-containing protein [Longimicrobiales bacterium]